MKKRAQKKTIIPYTTTCPYCGHRILHENLKEHVVQQHPTEAEDEAVYKDMDTREPNLCPYCNQSIPFLKLADHIYKKHPKQHQLAKRKIIEKTRKERREKIAKHRRSADPRYQLARIRKENQEKLRTIQDVQKAKIEDEKIFCKYCFEKIRRGDLEEHILIHNSEA